MLIENCLTAQVRGKIITTSSGWEERIIKTHLSGSDIKKSRKELLL